MTRPRKIRRAGSPWRLLVHEYLGGKVYGTSHGVEPNPGSDGEFYRHHQLPENTEFDELVVGKWLHIEELDTGFWYLHIGGVVVHVAADRDGRPKRVTVHGPGHWMPVDGAEYDLDWGAR